MLLRECARAVDSLGSVCRRMSHLGVSVSEPAGRHGNVVRLWESEDGLGAVFVCVLSRRRLLELALEGSFGLACGSFGDCERSRRDAG